MRRFAAVGAVVAALALGLAACGGGSSSSQGLAQVSNVSGSPQTNKHYPGATVVLPKPSVKPSVSLTDTAGQPYDMANATAGKVTLLYFGYTHCPDVCPINMALAASAINHLPAADRNKVTTVFITTDPDRDTPPVIKAWLANFSPPAFVGLTGTIDQIHQAEQQVGMPLSVVDASAAGTSGYQVTHAGYILAYSPDNQAHLEFYDNETVSNFTTSLQHLIEHGYQA